MSVKRHLLREFCRATAYRALRSSAVLFSDGGANYFSGVLVEAHGRRWIATAKHCVADIRDRESLGLATDANQKPILPLGARAILIHPSVDVAIIDLGDEASCPVNGDWVQEVEMRSEGAQPRKIVCALGFPGSFVRREEQCPLVVHPTPHPYVSEVSSRWPSVTLQYPATGGSDFFIERDKDNTLDEVGARLPPYTPEGMSGCGVYVVPRPHTGAVWHPGQAHLAGVFVSYIDSENLIRCVRIEAVLDLLAEAVELGE